MITPSSCVEDKKISSTDSSPEIKELPVNEQEEDDENIFCYVVEKMPEFPGGTVALQKFLNENNTYTPDYRGRVIVQTTIDEQGYVTEPTVVRSLTPEMDSIALSIIRKMPKWQPGELRGVPVKIKYTIPVSFGFK